MNGRHDVNSDQQPPEPSYPGGKAAERRREQLAREFGEEPPDVGTADEPETPETDENDDVPAEERRDAPESSEE